MLSGPFSYRLFSLAFRALIWLAEIWAKYYQFENALQSYSQFISVENEARKEFKN